MRYDYTALLAQSRNCDVDIEIQDSVSSVCLFILLFTVICNCA